MSKIEKLDVNNIIEVKRIRGVLQSHPELLTIFEVLMNNVNKNINTEKGCISMEIEDNEFDNSFLCSDSDEELDGDAPHLQD
tara:strand:+ start:5486 stop:5731 length:246 start_codon:yes stop_codon:yes gene_type:complete